MKIKLIILIVLFISIYANAQQTLTLEDCYSLSYKNYPLSKQTGLLEQKSSYEIDALSKENYQNRCKRTNNLSI